MSRRLPIYLIVDTSGSMAGEPIEAVRRGMKMLVAELKGDPFALEAGYLSVITFDSGAQEVAALADLMSFQEPTIDASPLTGAREVTALGEALRLLQQCVDREVVRSTSTEKGDWKPVIFLMTDGHPSDNWERELENLKQRRLGKIIVFPAGSGADENLLKRVTDLVVRLSDEPSTIQEFWQVRACGDYAYES